MGFGALKSDIEKPLILRGCEPFAFVTTALNQIEEYPTTVEIGILPCQFAADGEIGRPARSLQSILSISFIGAAMLDQKIFTKKVYGIVLETGIRGVAHAFSKCDRVVSYTTLWDTTYRDRVPARGVRALRSTRLPAVRAGTFRLPRWAA